MTPFIELPITIVNQEQKTKEIVTRMQPSQIEYYYPGFYNGTVIVMKSANSFLSPLSIDEIDSALLAYHNFDKMNKGKFGNLKIEQKQKTLHHVTS